MTTGLTRRLLLGIFALSGFSGLIYESVWTHYLKLFLAHSAYAQALVLVIIKIPEFVLIEKSLAI